ncbi:MAG TPA: ABC transporter permease [Anaerolineaceae bacterium]|nr:ABC transporter permease [Anaerolineaceae bacterium]
MILRNSLLSIFRVKGKTALFTLLLFALTLAFALGVSVWASVAQFLDDANDFYTTIGLVEYMGTGYPDDTGYDSAMTDALASFDPAAVTGDDAVLQWEGSTRSLGYIDGFWRSDQYMPDRMLSVLVVGNVYFSEERNTWVGIVMKALHSLKSEENTLVLIDEDFGTFEQGHFYLVFGEIYFHSSPLLHLRPATFDNAIAAAEGVEIPRMIDVTSSDTDGPLYTLPVDHILLKVAETLPVTNNSVLVTATDNLMALLPFHQEDLYFVEGRSFTKEEYAQGSRVCVISKLMADRLGIGIGGTLDLSVAVSDQGGVYNSYWVEDGFSYTESFTVVGITNTLNDKSWYMYVPRSAGVPASHYPVGYTVGQAVIENDAAADFYTRVQPLLSDRMQLTLYDQGYASVALPFQTILRLAKIVTAVCALLLLAVVVLFGFLFVHRQRETSETMLMLGTGRLKVCAHFLYSAGLIALVAVSAGAVAGYFLHERIIRLVAGAADHYKLIDARFSNGNLSTTRTLEFAPQLSWELFLLVGAAVFILAVLACLAFVLSSFRHNRPSQRRPAGPRKEHRTSRLRGGSLKYAVLSILRGGARSLVVPLLAVAAVIFFGQLTRTTQYYAEQLEAVYDNTRIDGYFTDINGKQVGNLVLSPYQMVNFYRSGLVEDLSVSYGMPYYYLGVSQLADGTQQEVTPLYAPENLFAREAIQEEIQRGPDLSMTNNIRTAPDLYYADNVEMAFLDGFDESFLGQPYIEGEPYNCMVSTALMKEKGIALGDTVRVAVDAIRFSEEFNARIFFHIDMRVVGSYVKQGSEDTIYAPLSLHLETNLIWQDGIAGNPPSSEPFDERQNYRFQNTSLHSASFSLPDSRALSAFKDYLADKGYSQVRGISSVREFIVLKDASFNNAVAGIKQQMRYISILYPCLYVLAGIIALVISYLLVVSRKAEFATMRGLGAPRLRSFLSFFLEQGVLLVTGTALGLAAWWLIWGAPGKLHLWLSAGFIACYLAGSAISIAVMNHASALAILSDRE